MGTSYREHHWIESEIQAKIGDMPIEQRIRDLNARNRMFALGEYSAQHRIKDDILIAQTYFDTWTELRRDNLSDDQIGKIFQAGKNVKWSNLKELK